MWARVYIFNFIFFPLYANIVSLDLCADQWVIGLNPKQNIHSVSHLAKDSKLSYVWQEAQHLKTHTGSPEEFINDPSVKVVIGYEPISPLIKILCHKKGIRLIALSYPQSMHDLKKQTLFLTSLFPNPSLQKKWVKGLTPSFSSSSQTSVFYGAQGACPGSQTLLGDILKATGYKNLYGAQIGWTYKPIESLLSKPLSVIFLLDPPSPHPIWKWFRKKKIPQKNIPYRLTLCPYPPAIFELITFLKGSSHA